MVPTGFPQLFSASGTLKDSFSTSVDVGEAIDGSITASVKIYPSPVQILLSGLDGMIREPGGCFEQTSSTNYPNIMILSYLATNDADPTLSSPGRRALDRGYKLLTGYETKQKGYEWFGQTPGHEALTAYGLMEFADMGKVYDVDHSMVERTADWLMSRRDGKGGFLRDAGGARLVRPREASDDERVHHVGARRGEAHERASSTELAARRSSAQTTKDPYLLALVDEHRS